MANQNNFKNAGVPSFLKQTLQKVNSENKTGISNNYYLVPQRKLRFKWSWRIKNVKVEADEDLTIRSPEASG